MFATSFTLLLLGLLAFAFTLDESERLIQYHSRNYTWPPRFVPETPGWNNLMRSRLEQVNEIDNLNRRYEGYVQVWNYEENYLDFSFFLRKPNFCVFHG